MSRVKLALAAGLGVTAVAIALVLVQHPVSVLATNSMSQSETLAVAANKSARACQGGERLPSGTVAIRLSIGAYTGPDVAVSVLSGGRVLASGEKASGWDGQNVTIPVGHIARSYYPVTLCFTTTQIDEQVNIYGQKTAKAIAARPRHGAPLKGRVAVEYMREGRSSWLGLLPHVAKQMGLGRAWSGLWISFFVAFLMLAVTVLAARLIFGEVDV